MNRAIGRPFASLFPPLVWTVLAGTFLTRTAFFMVWPFVAVILQRDFHLGPATIGSILGVASLAGTLLGFYSGNLSDRLGRRVVMTGGCVAAVAAYAVLATASSVAAYSVGACLVGFARAGLESPSTALIADYVQDRRSRHLAFHARYFLINVGGALGPLFGLACGLSAKQPTFWITAAAYTVFLIVLTRGFRQSPEPVHHEAQPHVSFTSAVNVLARDRRFLLLLVANCLVMFAYAQQESTLIQYVSLAGGPSAISLVTALLATNGLTIVVFQFPLLRLLGSRDLYVRTYLGLTLFAVAFAGYAGLPVRHLAPWIAATWVLSVGEAILFPTLQLQVDRMAQGHLRGSYFGAAGLSGLGFGAGPFVGGFLLEHVGGRVTFSITAVSMLIAGVCYRLSARHDGQSRNPAIRLYGQADR